ncbi:MAG: SMC family ATPase [Dehalococcoidales bacterium]|nr:SMC family ATPase [Dehalococcoidales bacterium]
MIPVRLALRNFLPYRDNVPPLDFTGIHTASIWGENGNGKSSLIDAITWALWGKSRAKSDDDLIHLRADETEVEFDFAVGQQAYRVIRKHARPRRRQASGQSSLDLLVASNGGFKVISGNSIRETEQKIRDTLHMDYATFINSAYLRQGHADEFTQQPPLKRKEVLANILGLSSYDELEEQARELARQKENEKTLAERTVQDIGNELTQKPAYEAELKQALAELSQTERVLAEQETRLKQLRQSRELLASKQWQLNQLEKHMAESRKTLELLDSQVKQHHSRIKEYEELIARRSTIEESYSRFLETKKLSERLDQKLRLTTALNERKHRLEMAILEARQVLLREQALAESKIGELEANYQKLPQHKSELKQAQAELNGLAGEEEMLNQKRQAVQELRTHLHSQQADAVRLEQELEEIKEKLELLSGQTEAKCPLCERELGEDHRRLIEEKYTAEKHHKTASLETIRDDLAQQRIKLDSAENDISRLETRLTQAKSSVQSKTSLLNREIEQIEKAASQLDALRGKLNETEEQLVRQDFAHSEHEALRQLEAELATLDYNSQQHEETRQRLAGLEQYEEPKRRLDEADSLIKQERDDNSRAEQTALELRQSFEVDRQKAEELTGELSGLPQMAADLTRAEAEYQKSSTQQKQDQERVGNIKGKLQHFSELELRAKEKEELLGQVSKEEAIYRDLAQAFGKKGIQAWLIELALPEIELEANRLLGRMTDNRMHVKIETQRETKRRDSVETLDIKIADELGTRDYEMFSGGEAFRINFAIRIALSKLLARRAGAPLPTLIIDEGFGTQDSVGLEKLKEAISSIQDDFEKIIVITHIEEFRDAFPNRIDVIKTAEGSTLEVS